MVMVGSTASSTTQALSSPPSSWMSLPPESAAAATTTAMTNRNREFDKMPKEEDRARAEAAPVSVSDVQLSYGERAVSAAGAAVISAILVNPLDVAKTRLQAQAAGGPHSTLYTPKYIETPSVLPDIKHNPSSTRVSMGGSLTNSPDGFRYKSTADVLYKVIRQEGFSRLWRGTSASLALAVPQVGIYMPLYDIFLNFLEERATEHFPVSSPYVPLIAGSLARTIACITCYPVDLARTRMQAFKVHQSGTRPPGVLKTLVGVISSVKSPGNNSSLQNYRFLWTGLGAQLARDVPFSAICWSTLEPIRRRILALTSDEPSAGVVLGANFCAGFAAGSLAAAATCPLDVARTRRQIENDPARALRMTTRQTLHEILRDGGMKGLFTGVGPRVGRAGPSVGIVVSFYEVVKYALQQRHLTE
ncbi:OLC1v1038434C1 [Oldenlandia corymbosa var. corymbosa]|uniref:OLC1v1038434C1 n=1 Tax=Oldenlandia corymbosa var. corymbosa TaxID=529605 RepID=A0AAV1D2W9_OLDCO|nr:OLC1v1038434C1 [Oldenlandia corymbosa var. corymbosa]